MVDAKDNRIDLGDGRVAIRSSVEGAERRRAERDEQEALRGIAEATQDPLALATMLRDMSASITLLRGELAQAKGLLAKLPADAFWLDGKGIERIANREIKRVVPAPFLGLADPQVGDSEKNVFVKVDTGVAGGTCYLGEGGSGDTILHRFRPTINSDDDGTCDVSAGSWIAYGFEAEAAAVEGIGDKDHTYIVATADYSFPGTLTISAQADDVEAREYLYKRLIAVLTYDITGEHIVSILRHKLGDIVGEQMIDRFMPYMDSSDPDQVYISEGSWIRDGVIATASDTLVGSQTNIYIVATIDISGPTLTISAQSSAPAALERQSKRLIAKLTYASGVITAIERYQRCDIIDGELPDAEDPGAMLAWNNTDKRWRIVPPLDPEDDAVLTFDSNGTDEGKVKWLAHSDEGKFLGSATSGLDWAYGCTVDGSEDGEYTVVTDIQYNSSTHALEKKWRTVTVTKGRIEVSAEEGWDVITTASECPA